MPMGGMLDIQTYLKDMTEWMGPNHERVASRPYTEMWDYCLQEKDDNILIFAPRKSGKTLTIIREFIKTPNSMLVVPNTEMAMHTRNMCRRVCESMGENANTRHFELDVIPISTSYRVRGRMSGTIFIDEICHMRYREVEDLIMMNPHMKRVAVSTPNGINPLYERYFRCVTLPEYWITKQTTRDHFMNELFTI